MPLINYQKKLIRRLSKNQRSRLSCRKRVDLSKKISRRLANWIFFSQANRIASFSSIGDEVDTSEVITYILGSGRELLLPKVISQSRILLFFKVNDLITDTKIGFRGILEPDPEKCEQVSLIDADMVLVPGLAFSLSGDRLGYGGGYYDATLRLKSNRAKSVGLSFQSLVYEKIPVSRSDEKLDAVVTECAIFERH